MANPFEHRATEYLADEVFISLVSPLPLTNYFSSEADQGRLYDRLVYVIGTPGSGKTTLARLFRLNTVNTVLRSKDHTVLRPLVRAIRKCNVINDKYPQIIGVRLPMESEYREYWELPYSEELRIGLMTAMIQARAVIGWLHDLEGAGYEVSKIKIIPREKGTAAINAIGGIEAVDILQRAEQVEHAIYNISAALIPPKESDILPAVTEPYRPFDVIKAISVQLSAHTSLVLHPLVMLDDAHNLHPAQLNKISYWLKQRELTLGRWLLMRLDLLRPEEIFNNKVINSNDRDEVVISLQSDILNMKNNDNNIKNRNEKLYFRKIAKDITMRYLQHIPLYAERRLTKLENLLLTAPVSIGPKNIKEMSKKVESSRSKLSITQSQYMDLEARLKKYFHDDINDENIDVYLAMLNILMYRFSQRRPQIDLFSELEVTRPLQVDASLAEGACIHLLHQYERPYYYGFENICDASNANTEQFLRLVRPLVNAIEVRITQNIHKPESLHLNPAQQHKLLKGEIKKQIAEWDFPEAHRLRKLVKGIADWCIARSLQPNAPLGGGAVAVGVSQEDFDNAVSQETNKLFTSVLHYGIAYNILRIQRRSAKNHSWVLIELSGTLRLYYNLTLKDGGFVERQLRDLFRLVED